MPTRIYLDHNATAPLADEARAAMTAAMALGGNPSSVHAEGRAARSRIEAARRDVARLIAGAADEIVFTSGGTEANRLGIEGLYRQAVGEGQPARVAVAAIDHPSVQGAVARLVEGGATVVALGVDRDGRIDPAGLAAAAADGLALCVLSLANHELGTVQDVVGLARLAAAAGARVHVDAVQAAGRRALAAAELGADAMALSSHKLGGPAGAGALWLRRGGDLGPGAAGHQERGRRPGTENLIGIAGFGAAAARAVDVGAAEWRAVEALTRRLEGALAGLGLVIHGAGAPRIGNTICAELPGGRAEVVVQALDLAGVAVSAGAACTSGSVAPSPVLLALGLDRARAGRAIRFSLGRGNRAAEVDRVLEILPPILAQARRYDD